MNKIKKTKKVNKMSFQELKDEISRLERAGEVGSKRYDCLVIRMRNF